MKNIWLCFVPTLFFAGVITALYAFPDAARGWAAYPFFNILPYVMFAIAFLLGGLFNQSYISGVSAVLIITGISLKVFALSKFDEHITRGILVFSYVWLPILTVMLYRAGETGLFSKSGVKKLLLATGITAGVFLCVDIEPAKSLFYSAYQWFQSGHWMPVPGTALCIFAIATPLLFIKSKKHFTQGYFLFLTLEFSMFGLSFRSNLWRGAGGLPVLHACFGGAALVLIYAVLENLWRNSAIDALTQLPNRRALEQRLARLNGLFAIAVLDIDNFKKINDTYGHDTGDQALRYVASHLAACDSGTAYRHGGEEFTVIFPKTGIKTAVKHLEKTRRDICERNFVIRSANKSLRKKGKRNRGTTGSRQAIKITVSIGVAECAGNDIMPADVMRSADIAMYTSKTEGKNRVTAI